ncbi:hypothetical protein CAEBREN_06489 [Caenorhabditis brenneri]|uniref:Uncharacterized protein n=1 Tax=Caenorhabditis brenneri TaxID=135651 RepID=G0PKN2_CAEBE|nr:hypothetical protein CAEBREN_06489 [Caenorhabditis brenneri]
MAPPVTESKVVKVEKEPEKKPRHSTEISINTGFEMDKKMDNNKSSSVSVVV